MWTFLVELAVEEQSCRFYPETLFSHGEMPDESEEKTLKLKTRMILLTSMKTADEEDLDMFGGDDSFEDFGSEENWN
jgi:hypothetical protein